MKLTIEDKAKLNNGVEIPYLGLGVYKSAPGSETYNAVRWALEAGYRHIDTAAFYKNEKDVGRAVKDSGIPREEIFVTTKLWNDDHGYEKTLRGFEVSLKNLGFDYMDLYLLHWPVSGLRNDSYRALETILKESKARAIGVSNYTTSHLTELLSSCRTVPAVNQVEFSPFLYQKRVLEFCRQNEIQLEAYSPLARASKLSDERLREVAGHYGKTAAQMMVRWALEHKIVIIPKSTHKERIFENADVFNFEISEGDMEILDSLDENYRVAWDPSRIP
ncbi:MAG: aldo/keto reductase [Ignavibacteria bacterium]|jgi:diketogulonate reductase-like aldo/keto reductase|nr:aldo/keto reductase [Ignavibacteria bacterium]MCU7503747.1 aldo/keto reductase [Ignavibacteria bacterium]MCU7517239.1 aldo/keto reductase [Ignavibacteria bacterium]